MSAISCPYCRGQIVNDPKLAGLAISCPHCRKAITMPAMQQAAPPAPAPAANSLEFLENDSGGFRSTHDSDLQTGGISDLFDMGFTKFITPTVVKVIYTVVIALTIFVNTFGIVGVSFLAVHDKWSELQITLGVLGCMFQLVLSAFGILFVRLLLEGILIIFRIEEHLRRSKG